jgi:hypothetical protein
MWELRTNITTFCCCYDTYKCVYTSDHFIDFRLERLSHQCESYERAVVTPTTFGFHLQHKFGVVVNPNRMAYSYNTNLV